MSDELRSARETEEKKATSRRPRPTAMPPGSVEETAHDPPPRRRGRLPGGHAGRGRFDPGVERAIEAESSIDAPAEGVGIVWLDHRRGRLLVRRQGGASASTDFENSEYRLPKATGGQAATAPAHLGGSPESHRRRHREEWLHRYYDEIADALEPLAGFAIAGPGPAKNELHRRIALRHGLEDRLLGVVALPARVGDAELAETLDRLIGPP